MAGRALASNDPISQSRLEIRNALGARRGEIEADLHNRLNSIVDEEAIDDPEYVDGLRRSVTAGVEFALAATTASERHPPTVPAVLISQARLAARNRLSLDTLVLRYSACRTVIANTLVMEAEKSGLVKRVRLSDLLRFHGVLFDRLVTEVSAEYRREIEKASSSRLRRFQLARGLLEGEALEKTELAYDFDVSHIGFVIRGGGAFEAAKSLVANTDCTALIVRDGDLVWAWFGQVGKRSFMQIQERASSNWSRSLCVAMGALAHGFSGWRLTHNQAKAAFVAALRTPGTLVRYAADPLLVAALRDAVLNASLQGMYLAPLAEEKDGGSTLRTTLRAYFAADRNGASAAAALDVSRQTVTNRLRTVEGLLRQPLPVCANALDTALKLQSLERLGN